MNSAISKMRALTLAAGLLITSALALPAAETYEIDPVHSWVVFKVKHMGVGYARGLINVKSGTVVVDDADPSKSSVELVLDPSTILTGNPKRDQHLTSPDFFNVKEFPEVTFKSTAIKGTELVGDLTMLGKTKSITATYTEIGKGKGMQGETLRGGEAVITFKRSDFGMTFGLDNGALADEVEIVATLEGKMK